ncbi:Serpin (serine protease inhibitor) [Popillia japonica]|uniref:Serpin (Serine protease inhibitor) n=1 Tax=Popillia japonica TaxID=7064 RepID=A0AAW1IAC9_POPJA
MELNKLFAVLLLAVITSATDLSVKSDDFAKTVYKHLSEKGKNSVFSPLSLHAVLALAYQGSAKHTEQILHNHFLSKSSTSNGYQALLWDLNTAKNVSMEIANKIYVRNQALLWDLNTAKNVSMEIANKIYVRNDRQFKKEFENIAKDKFLAEVDSVDFRQNQLAANIINDWVKEKTHGEWASKFNKLETQTVKFYLDDTQTVNCPMMHQSGSYSMGDSEDLDATLLRLKFRNQRFSLIIILPKTKTGIERLEEKLPTTDVAALTRKMWGRTAEVYLPRFKIESEYDFKKPFEQIGLGGIYSDNAEFSEIVESETLKVSKIIQKATIEINEEGGEASAATAVIVAIPVSAHYEPPPPAIFRADHPFMYLLTFDLEETATTYDFSKESVVLFMGKVSKIIQKATIEINEDGGEASTATAIIVVGTLSLGDHPPPPIFRADHPFMYLLTYDLEETTTPFDLSKKSIVLFMGKVAKPEIVN